VLAQAAGLALLSALSPTALLIAAVYLGSARPGLTSFFYLAGAVLMSIVMGVVILIALRSAGLNHPDQREARYGLRFGLGILFFAAAAFVATRKPRSRDPAKAQHGLVSRMVADPAPLSAFVVGLLVFAPGVTFIAALQVIATARADPEVTTLALLLVVVINVLLVWLPITLHLVAPHSTEKRLKAFNSWLRANGRTVLAGVLVVAGGIMVSDGIYGLITRPG
jgi:Sap-like sulfolipid-1-addressing protein